MNIWENRTLQETQGKKPSHITLKEVGGWTWKKALSLPINLFSSISEQEGCWRACAYICFNETESREQGQTLEYCSVHSLIPCSFFDSLYIFPKLLSLGLVFPRAPASKLDVRQLVQFHLGTWNSPARFSFLNKRQSPECQQNQGLHNEEWS